MKKIYLLAAVSVLTLSGAEVWAAEANGTGNISAKIVAPVEITQQDALDFGTILASDSGTKKVTIAPSGVRSGDAKMLVGINEGKAGLFTVTGSTNQRMTIQLPASASLTGPGDPMTVDNFVSEPASELVLNGTSGQIKVGADLNVAEGQEAGDYSTTYQITVNY